MRIKFKAPYLSIKQLENIDLPLFTLLTGLNGSGKTHILKAIEQGKIIVEGIPQNKIKFFSYLDFKVSGRTSNRSEIEASTAAAWQRLSDKQYQLRGFYNQCFPQNQNDKSNQYLFNNRNQSIFESKDSKIRAYADLIKINVFDDSQFKQQVYSLEIIRAIKKLNKPLHLITKEEFNRVFVPSIPNDNYLSTGLGIIFTKYKTDRFNWIHNEWDKRNTNIDKATLEEEYEKNNPKPWILIDEILGKVNSYSTDSSIFNFQITNPENDKLTLQSLSSYGFNPRLIDIKTKEPRNFNELSSGESVLLALAISIYESNDKFDMPQVLLLDEVDATLHPSMIQALLDTIRDVFVNNGIFTILATHKPTTVALSDEKSIYLVEKNNIPQKIIKESRKKALSILTEGYATLSDIKILFENILKSTADVILITEGESDITHIKKAKEIFFPKMIVDYFSCNCATKLKSFLIGMPLDLFPNKKIIGIFDFDGEGIKQIKNRNFQEISEYIYKSKSNENIFAVLLPIPNDGFEKYEYCPIEFLYSQEVLEKYQMIVKRNLSDINATSYVKQDEARIMNLTDFENKIDLCFFEPPIVGDEGFPYRLLTRL